MRSRLRTAHHTRDATSDVGMILRAGGRARAVLTTAAEWLRAGYPDEAPAYGYSPLIALNGPTPLTREQRECAIRQLGGAPASPTEIEMAITKATNRLPTPGQVRTVSCALRRMPPH